MERRRALARLMLHLRIANQPRAPSRALFSCKTNKKEVTNCFIMKVEVMHVGDDASYVTRQEHVEFERRLDEHNRRQDARLKQIEQSVSSMNDLVVNVGKLATSVEHMAVEQKSQGERLDKIESRDGDMWRNVVGYTVTAIIGILIGIASSGVTFQA